MKNILHLRLFFCKLKAIRLVPYSNNNVRKRAIEKIENHEQIITHTVYRTVPIYFAEPEFYVKWRAEHYASVDGVKRGVQTWIKQTPAAFFQRGIMDIVSRWQSEVTG